MENNIDVSIVSISYNHERYIEQMLQSLAAQKRNFNLEIIIGDDASTDDTQKIITKFEDSYEGNITTVLRKKNIGAANNVYDVYQRANGRYIAVCEGDDYWSDEHKLQKQFDFMEANLDYSICFHPVEIIDDTVSSGMPASLYPDYKEGFTLDKLLETNFIQTNSVMYRSRDYTNLPEDIMPVDWYMSLLHAKHGKIKYIDNVMSVYRKHHGGIWQDGAKVWKNYGIQKINMLKEVRRLYPEEKYESIIDKNIFTAVESVFLHASDNYFSLDNLLKTHSDAVMGYIKACRENEKKLAQGLSAIRVLRSDVLSKNQEIRRYKERLVSLENSRSYKIGRGITSMPRKLASFARSNNKKSNV
jgi:glycosyltransferase involved in cell wall biosynthesis